MCITIINIDKVHSERGFRSLDYVFFFSFCVLDPSLRWNRYKIGSLSARGHRLEMVFEGIEILFLFRKRRKVPTTPEFALRQSLSKNTQYFEDPWVNKDDGTGVSDLLRDVLIVDL